MPTVILTQFEPEECYEEGCGDVLFTHIIHDVESRDTDWWIGVLDGLAALVPFARVAMLTNTGEFNSTFCHSDDLATITSVYGNVWQDNVTVFEAMQWLMGIEGTKFLLSVHKVPRSKG
jgi:hypothetical protein